MSNENTAAKNPRAHLIEGKPVHTRDGHGVVTVTNPTCPACGGDLVLRRVEVREVFHALRKAEVYDGGLGLLADLDVADETQSDECLDVQSDSVVCGNAYRGCTYQISGSALNIDWS